MGVTTAVIAAVGAAGGAVQQSRARGEQRRASALQQRRADIQQQRQTRAQIRQARAQRAQVANVAAQTGVATSSANVGAQASIGSQFGSNVGFIQQTGALSQGIAAANQRAANALGRAGLFQTAGNLALSAGSSGIFNRTPNTLTTTNNPNPATSPF